MVEEGGKIRRRKGKEEVMSRKRKRKKSGRAEITRERKMECNVPGSSFIFSPSLDAKF